MPTNLYPILSKFIEDEWVKLDRDQITPWVFMTAGPAFRCKDFYGREIAYQGIKFEGSPRQVFWGRYIEPFLEDLVHRMVEETLRLATARKQNAQQPLAEVGSLLKSVAQRAYRGMADIDQRLRGEGFPNRVPQRRIDGELARMEQFIDQRIQAECAMAELVPSMPEKNLRKAAAMSETAFRFDFALSFAGPNRTLAEEIKNALKSKGFSVFYDRDFEHEMLGRDGSVYLRDIYSRESRHCLVLISEQYDQRAWTQLERESIQSRELRGELGVLIPVLVDGHTPRWLIETRIYFDLRSRKVEELVQLLVRLREVETDSPSRDEEVRVAAACTAIQVHGEEFVTQCRAHLTLALQDGFVRIRLGYPSTKTEAGRLLIQLGALELLEDRPTGSRGAKYGITTLGTQVLHRLRQG